MLNKSQILGLFIAVTALSLGLLWEKTFNYADVFDFILGVIAAIGLSFTLKLLPLKLKKK